jgi:low temperature requirement protein LtrA
MTAHPRGWRRRMTARDPHEPHRISTPLELLYDLCFVVAIAQAGGRLHHGIVEGHAAQAALGYAVVFFAIWWAWMNFTWFASAYDTDDVPYRLLVLVQIAGVLVLAAGVARGLDGLDFRAIVAGFVLMRLGMVAQWLRAARSDPERRRTALRYAGGLAVLQALWLGMLFLPHGLHLFVWVVLAAAELAVPVWAERAAQTSWHPHHIAERYGLMTLIVLGESILAATVAVQAAMEGDAPAARLLSVAAGGLLILFSMWWLYFTETAHERLRGRREAFVWGYGHLVIFASAAAVGAGLAVAADDAAGSAHVGQSAASAAVVIPVSLYLLALWAVHLRHDRATGWRRYACPAVAVALPAVVFLPGAVVISGLALAGLVVVASHSPITSSGDGAAFPKA